MLFQQTLLTKEGKNIYPSGRPVVALCRCGRSNNKPFCDGQHWHHGFRNEPEEKEKAELKKTSEYHPDKKAAFIQKLADTGENEDSAMNTTKKFPTFDTIVFKGAQLYKMPLNEDVEVNTKTVIGKTAKQPLLLKMPFYV